MLKLRMCCIILLMALRFISIYGYDYCKLETEKCGEKRHIVCKPNQMEMKAATGDQEYKSPYKLLPMTSKVRKAIIDEHNKVRNELACGKVRDKNGDYYFPAAHMRELIWDTELEYVARKHAELCVFDHDECRVTSKYELAGQNLAVRYASEKQEMMGLARHFVNAWYEEYKLATVEDLNAIKGTPGIGHFTQLANDRVTRVGCAITRCSQRKTRNDRTVTKYLYTCDYSFSNIFGMATYKNASSPASNCAFVKAVKSENYKCLCANSDHQ